MIKLKQEFLEWCRDNRVRDVEFNEFEIVAKISFFEDFIPAAVKPQPAPVPVPPAQHPAAQPMTDDDVLFWSAQPSTTSKPGGEQ